MSYKKIPVKTWYLKYNGDLTSIHSGYRVDRWESPNVDEYLNLYNLVGEKWGWSGRLLLTRSELAELLSNPLNEIWLFKKGATILGFIEIDKSIKGKAEIVYFGLIPESIGKGHGKAFLDTAICLAAKNGSEVWLHTCEYDHPKALEIYIKAGFEIIEERVDEEYYSEEYLDNY